MGMWRTCVSTVGDVGGGPVGLFGNTGQRLYRQRPAYPARSVESFYTVCPRSRCQPVRLPELWQSSFQEAAGARWTPPPGISQAGHTHSTVAS